MGYAELKINNRRPRGRGGRRPRARRGRGHAPPGEEAALRPGKRPRSARGKGRAPPGEKAALRPGKRPRSAGAAGAAGEEAALRRGSMSIDLVDFVVDDEQ